MNADSLNNFFNKNKTFILVGFFFLLFCFDLGNQNSPRQGTEGFYLEISKEMYLNKDYITPHYLGEPHFSKPPFQFWVSQFFYSIFGSNLSSSRFSILFVSFFLVVFLSYWLYKKYEISFLKTFFVFISSFGFIKYSRIFMMESFLTFFTGIGTIIAFNYFKKGSLPNYILASLLLAFSSLIKGPISLIMAFGTLFIYAAVNFEQKYFKKFFQLFFTTFFISSLWFLASIYKHGVEFIDYFFWRENLGKFTSRSYGPIVLVQGIILFTFPHFHIFVISLVNDFKAKKIEKSSFKFFLLLATITFWAIWLIPSQRSHHYAMPAYFFLLIYTTCSELSIKVEFFQQKLLSSLTLFLSIVGTLACFILIYLRTSFPLFSYSIIVFLLIFFLLIFIFRKRNTYYLGIYTLSLFLIWYVLSPMFSLPIIPSIVESQFHSFPANSTVGAVYRKPFFISEQVNRPITSLSPIEGEHEAMQANYDLLILPSSTPFLTKYYKLLSKWRVWKRGVSTAEVFHAFKQGNITTLQDEYILLQKNH